jgi:hypothetical protein
LVAHAFLLTNSILPFAVCGLTDLHSRKIIHRDLKPKNILIDCAYTEVHTNLLQLKICDYGLSRWLNDASKANTHRVGTDYYMVCNLFVCFYAFMRHFRHPKLCSPSKRTIIRPTTGLLV